MKDSTIASRIAGSKTGRIDTLIIGAGVAGLTLAALLRQRGENPVIIDKEKDLHHLGYHLALYPHGARVLHGLGLYQKYLDETVPMKTYTIHNGSGKLLHTFPLREINEIYGAVRGITRQQLISLLTDALGDSKIHLNTTVTSLVQDDQKVNITFSDNSTHAFDLVVAADGLHSATRKMLFKENEYKYYKSGWGGWIFWVDPSLGPANTLSEYWGPGRFVWSYPIRDHLALFVGGPVDTMKKEGIVNFTRQVREQFGRHDDYIWKMLESVDENAFYWDFHDCRMANWRKGRIIFIGDAAAGFLPTAGVGASMAMESAAALNDELSRTDAHFVEQALDLFEKRHRRRVEANQEDSRKLAKLVFLKSGPPAWLRDQGLKMMTIQMLFKDIKSSIDEPI